MAKTKEKTMNTEVTKVQNTAVANIPAGQWGFENVLAEDIRIPKLLLVQQMSDMATNEKINARPGEIRESFEGRLMATKEKPLQIIPFYTTNTWTVSRKVNGKWEFDHIDERTSDNSTREYEETLDGELYKNEKTLNIFALIKGENLTIPYMISMKGFSMKLAGNKFLSMGAVIRAEGEAYAHRVFNLSSQAVENDKGKFFAYSIEASTDSKGNKQKTSVEELTAAYKAYLTVSGALKSGAKINTGNLSDDAGSTVSTEEKF
jgi:hypothetical protein